MGEDYSLLDWGHLSKRSMVGLWLVDFRTWSSWYEAWWRGCEDISPKDSAWHLHCKGHVYPGDAGLSLVKNSLHKLNTGFWLVWIIYIMTILSFLSSFQTDEYVLYYNSGLKSILLFRVRDTRELARYVIFWLQPELKVSRYLPCLSCGFLLWEDSKKYSIFLSDFLEDHW